MTNYSNQRQPKTPPHVSLRSLRLVSGLTLDEVAAATSAVLGKEKPMNRGTIAAIESGLRGASEQLLDAIAVAYGLDPGSVVTDYEPRQAAQVSA